jgi:hypothetical protein
VRIARVFPVFAVVFVVLYVVAMDNNLALVTYFPRIRHWLPLAAVLPQSAGPGMYWYGWLATSAIGAAGCAALALLVPVNLLSSVARRAAWITPIGVMLAVVYILRGWFVH